MARKKRFELRRRMAAILLVVSLVPLGSVGLGGWLVFRSIILERSLQLHHTLVQSHAKNLDIYLDERVRTLRLAVHNASFEDLSDESKLARLFETINKNYEKPFVDLGTIRGRGEHLSYVGPFDLKDKNYSNEEWFRRVMADGVYVSDVFLGFRKSPHCIIAVKRVEGAETWILRATINSEEFEALVRTTGLGVTGESYLVNSQGRYQTPSKSHKVLEQSLVKNPAPHCGIRDSRPNVDGAEVLRSTVWLKRAPWMLVVQQDIAEIEAPLRRALMFGGAMMLAAVSLIFGATMLSTAHLNKKLEQASAERDALTGKLLQSAKLASLGKMAASVAHEINNPVSGVLNLSMLLKRIMKDDGIPSGRVPEFKKHLSTISEETARVGRIVSDLLSFSRRSSPQISRVNLNAVIEKTISLISHKLEMAGVVLKLSLDESLPEIECDKSQIQQVIINLVMNAGEASLSGDRVEVSTAPGQEEGIVAMIVSDLGEGISADDIQKIFDPFFTTKAEGKGIGMGLSVVFGIVEAHGGTIEVESSVGKGARFTVKLPVRQGLEEMGGAAAPESVRGGIL